MALAYIIFWSYQTNINKKKMAELENHILINNNNNESEAEYIDDEARELIEQRNSMDFAKLYEINPDTRGWLKIEKLGISYPIVQYTDNDYYLSKDVYKEDSISGSIYLDYRNNEFNDINTIIYGHNMKNDTMFGRLDEILKGKTGKDVDVLILTKDKTYKYKVFSTYEINPNDFRKSESLQNVLNKSAIDFQCEIDLSKKFISLYTCTDTSGERTIVHAYLEREV